MLASAIGIACSWTPVSTFPSSLLPVQHTCPPVGNPLLTPVTLSIKSILLSRLTSPLPSAATRCAPATLGEHLRGWAAPHPAALPSALYSVQRRKACYRPLSLQGTKASSSCVSLRGDGWGTQGRASHGIQRPGYSRASGGGTLGCSFRSLSQSRRLSFDPV